MPQPTSYPPKKGHSPSALLQRFWQQVGDKQQRKLRARRRQPQSLWYGLGLLGLLGWSVTVPTLLGVALGRWLDQHMPGRFSWTLALLLASLSLGCLNAWYWVSREQASITRTTQKESPHD